MKPSSSEAIEVECLICKTKYDDSQRRPDGRLVAPVVCGQCGSRNLRTRKIFEGEVLIVDQFADLRNLSPYSLQQRPMTFEALKAQVIASTTPDTFRPPEVKVIDRTFRIPHCTTIYCADERGNARVLATSWDSSD